VTIMRIVYQHRTLADGAEGVHIREMIGAFNALGHEVIVEAIASGGQNSPRGAGGFWARIKAALPAGLFELCAVALNALDYARFKGVLRNYRPDFVYKRHALNDAGVVLAARRSGVPVVLEVNCPYSSPRHQEFERVRFKRLTAWLEKRAFDSADLVVAVSTPLADYIRKVARDPDKVAVLPNGANPQQFTTASALGDAVRDRYGLSGSTVVGWVGILREWHRVDLLLTAIARLPSLRLLIIGDGPDQPRLERLASELGVTSRVTFTGRVPHAEMPQHVAALDVAVAADDRTGYASPMKLLEYMAAGRAVVAPRLSNIEDLIHDGHDGLLFQPGDVNDLATVLQRLATDTSLRARLGARARLEIESSRNWVRIAEEVIERLSRQRAAGAGSAELEAAGSR
jgi:glycosyltransferase involved in cell wall biosynthesis